MPAKFDRDQLRAWSAGLDIPAGAFGMGLVGWLIDRWQDTSPGWMLGLGLAGLLGGCYRFVREALRMNAKNAAQFDRQRRGRPRPADSVTPPPVAPDANHDHDDSPRP